MTASEQTLVFISYARSDGADLARRLQADLSAQGFNAWLDQEQIAGGAEWTKAIEDALDRCEFVLALLTPGSYASEICRAEQVRSLRKGKCVVPVLAQAGADVPLHLEARNYRDFTAGGSYSKAFSELLGDLHARNGIQLREQFRRTYVTAPPLPVNYVERTEALAKLRNSVITDGGSRQIALTALEGMGGIGKTVLALALCHDELVQHAFPDGVIWVPIGRESGDVVTRLREAGKALGDDLTRYDNEMGAKNQYRSTIRGKAALIVLDDVWNVKDLEAFRAGSSPRSRLLFTTRDASIAAAAGAHQQVAELLTEEQSRAVLARWSGNDAAKLPPVAGSLVRECGRLPLALAMVGAMLRGKPPANWKRANDLLRDADLEKIKMQFPDYPYPNVLRAFQVSVDELDATGRERYLALAVLLEEMAAAQSVQQCLWNVDEGEASETAGHLVELSLAQYDRDGASIRLHGLHLDYTRAQHPDRAALELIHGAVRLSANVIAQRPEEFASQMVGRLLPHEGTGAVAEFTKDVAKATPRPWLKPLWPCLHPPGTSLIRTLAGHSDFVYGVAVTADGQRVVSASVDKTLKVWDSESGQELRTLAGHSDPVTGVAVTADGRRAVSASWDRTLKVWDLESGQQLRTLAGHSDFVYGVAVTADGRRAVSACRDHRLKVWDLESGQELHTLAGHSHWVNGVAVTADGRRAVSASRDNTLKVWDLESGQELRTLVGHSASVNGVAVAADGRRAVSASRDHTLKVWDLESGQELRTLAGHSDWVNGVAVTADGRRAVSVSGDKTLKVWDLESGKELRTPAGHSGGVSGVAVTADGRRAVSASWDSTLKVWDLESGQELRTPAGHSGYVNGVAVMADGRRAVSASDDKTLKVWDLESGQELRTLAGHSDSVTGVAVTADGRRAISASDDKTLKVWDLESGQELHTLAGHPGYVSGVAVTADGRRAVSASWDSTLKVWDLESGQEVRTLAGHSAWVSAVAVTADGRRAVSASFDHTLKVWDLESGTAIAGFTCDAAATCCAFVGPDKIFGGDSGGRLYWLKLET